MVGLEIFRVPLRKGLIGRAVAERLPFCYLGLSRAHDGLWSVLLEYMRGLVTARDGAFNWKIASGHIGCESQTFLDIH